MSAPKNINILRNAKVSLHLFIDYFQDFEKVDVVKKLFGEKTDEVLRNIKIEFGGRRGYMGVSNEDGHINISANYLNTGDFIDIYLDVIHQLVHVKQFMDGKELFEPRYNYVNIPTEIEAYRCAVEEARRLGLSEDRICEYLRTDRITDENLQRLLETLNIRYKKQT